MEQLFAPGTTTGSQFGKSVALSFDFGAASLNDRVAIYDRREESNLRYTAEILAPGPSNPRAPQFAGFGPVAISGDTLVTTVAYVNLPTDSVTIVDTSVLVYKLDEKRPRLTSRFGFRPQVRFGNIVLFPTAVGFTQEDVILGFPFDVCPVFTQSGKLIGKLDASKEITPNITQTGFSIGNSGTTIVLSGSEELGGKAFVFDRNQGGPAHFGLVKVLKAPADDQANFFGSAVAISGDVVAVGSTRDGGTAYIYGKIVRGPNAYGLIRRVSPSHPQSKEVSNVAIAIWSENVLLGAVHFDSSPDVAYEFSQNVGGTNRYGEVKTLQIPDDNGNSRFGSSVALVGTQALIGAPDENAGVGALFGAELK